MFLFRTLFDQVEEVVYDVTIRGLKPEGVSTAPGQTPAPEGAAP